MWRTLFLLLPVLVQAAEEHGADHASSELTHKWINFGILAAGLLYLMAKFMFPALKARSSAIHQDLAESAAAVQRAEAQVAQLTAKLGNFEGELSEMRAKAMAERDREGKRTSEQSASLIEKIVVQREQEIRNLTQAVEKQLRQYTAEKAIELAQAKLATQTDPATQGALVAAFIRDLKKQEAR